MLNSNLFKHENPLQNLICHITERVGNLIGDCAAMWHHRIVTVLTYFLQLLTLINADQSPLLCKASLGSPDWPSVSAWTKLNDSISGRLLQPPPPGAVCHLGQPTYNNATCPTVQAEWYTAVFHQANPISNYWNNWNNDSCLPITPTGPCSGKATLCTLSTRHARKM